MTLRPLFVSSVATFGLCSSALAGMMQIEIQMSGVNLIYTDPDGGGAGLGSLTNVGAVTDALNGLDFLVDGALVGSLGFADDLDLDFTASSVPNIAVPAVGGTTTVVTPGVGSLELLVGGGSIIAIDLSSVQINYSVLPSAPDLFRIQFTGAVGSVTSQSLPFDLFIGNPIEISFSQQGSETEVGGFLTRFAGSGTGEITGPLVPAPAALAAMSLLALGGVRRRRASN